MLLVFVRSWVCGVDVDRMVVFLWVVVCGESFVFF